MTTDHSLLKEEGSKHITYSDTYDIFCIGNFLQFSIYLPISPSFPLLTAALFSFDIH